MSFHSSLFPVNGYIETLLVLEVFSTFLFLLPAGHKLCFAKPLYPERFAFVPSCCFYASKQPGFSLQATIFDFALALSFLVFVLLLLYRPLRNVASLSVCQAFMLHLAEL